ncbi:MAG: biotin/lipoyl-binding protein [Acidimicrobiia bacterium]|nr:biotin/lipoyl-binding protein [Acidimicrobiia bacterium]
MFQKVLIANRGEIAVRVMRTCRELGIATVAVYSDFDRDAKHVRYADEAVHLGGNLPAESYLRGDLIIEACRTTGAEAVHPGYGFLAENAAFVQQVSDAGVAFIGPPEAAIVKMGDKVSSRICAIEADFAPVPGTTDPISAAGEVIEFGKTHGWPVAIKASYGGGGKGLRVARGPEDAPEALAAAEREGESYFGNGECYMERYLERPRHIEIQILGDQHGNYVYLGERDCSAQRRHQKVVEETPSPAVDDDLRRRMGEAAIKVAAHVGYFNAGTVECLVQDGEFWFLEMNTRLQVEHCVTEQVYGLDLVAAQLRIAAGEKLWFDQGDVVRRGHSIELRINAEDPAEGFRPSPGRITSLRVPGGPGVRLDAGYDAGDEVSQFYDNLVGKLVVTGEDREQARHRALRALTELEVGGVTTNTALQSQILSHPDFVAGDVTTKWLETSLDSDAISLSPAPAVPAGDDGAEPEPTVERSATVEVGGRRFDVKVFLPESEVAAATAGPAASGARMAKRPKRDRGGVTGGGAPGEVHSPMRGTVLKVLVSEGAEVAAGDAVVVVEAMKMENNVSSPSGGTVKKVAVSEGDTVAAGDLLVVVE